MAMIRKRSTKDGKNYYQAVIRMQGFPSASASFPNKTEAKAWANQTENEIRQNKFFGHKESAKHSMAELIDRYITSEIRKLKDAKNRKQQLLLWREKLGKMKIADVNAAVVVKARDSFLNERIRGKGERSGASINRLLSALSHVFTIAEREWLWADSNPLKKVSRLKESSGRTRFLSDNERERLLAATLETSPILHLVTVLALSTGARRGEVLGLKWSDVDLKNGKAVLHDTKNSDTRALPITGYALKLFREHAKIRALGSDLVFHADDDPTKFFRFEAPWRNAVKKAELVDFRFHDCRHSAASALLSNGATLAQLSAILGHKTLAMVKRYAHLAEDDATELIAAMNARIFEE